MKAIITILGLSGTDTDDQRAIYLSNNSKILSQNGAEFFNMFELFCKSSYFLKDNEWVLVPLATKDSYAKNIKMISECDINSKIYTDPVIIDDKNFYDTFAKMATILEKYDETIIDITHGFRSIPVLFIINSMIQNFNAPEKIRHIFFAKEIKKHTKNESKGIYEIIDLKNYLDLANIAFLALNFSQNYTITQNIKISGFDKLIQSMKNFNENVLVLDLYELKTSSFLLLEQINLCLLDDKNISIFSGLKMMKDEIEYIYNLLDFNKNTRHDAFIKLSEKMLQKGYLLNALSLLFEANKEFLAYKISDNGVCFDNLHGDERYNVLQKLITSLNNTILDFKNFQILKEYLQYDTALNNDYKEWHKKLSELFYEKKDILEYIQNTIGRELDSLEIAKISGQLEKARQDNAFFEQLFGATKNKIVTRKWDGGTHQNNEDKNFSDYKKLFNEIRKLRNTLSHIKTSDNIKSITKEQIKVLKDKLVGIINVALCNEI